MTSLQYDDVDAELAASIRRYCADHLAPDADQPMPTGWWAGLAELGVLGLATPEGGGSVTSVAAAMEELGRANAPGPLVGTFLATQLRRPGDPRARSRPARSSPPPGRRRCSPGCRWPA